MLSILIVYVLLILFKENKILQKIFTQKIEERFLFTSSVGVFSDSFYVGQMLYVGHLLESFKRQKFSELPKNHKIS